MYNMFQFDLEKSSYYRRIRFSHYQKKKEKKIIVLSVFNVSTILAVWYFLYLKPLNMCQVLTNRKIVCIKKCFSIFIKKNHFLFLYFI